MLSTEVPKLGNEVLTRRRISSLYMAIFNFWAAIEYYMNNKKGSGISKLPDYFREVDFENQ
ncbi:hypothetical protein ACNF40_05405 [Cuniculiplasma sp. SKW4]|uniref:hypothetical protein n=1 Tax=Cuniculiplasma sp. SKW4 TaxID=3400171 RepID=UPI003FD2A66A